MSKKVLFFVDRMLTGGIQKLLFDLSSVMNKNKVIPEFLSLDDGKTYPMEEECKTNGYKVYKLKGVWVKNPNDFIKYRRVVKNFFKIHHDYCAVHMNSGPKNYYILQCAKKYNIPVRIAHSHNTDFQTKSKIQKTVGDICKITLKRYANVYLACSDLASEWMFGKALTEAGKVKIIPNGVDLDKFAYDEEKREQTREQLGLKDKTVIGNIGRFVPQKNHSKLIDIFAKLHEIDENIVLLLTGAGELVDSMKDKTHKLGLDDCVKFLGYRQDVHELLQAMDIYVMPSLYEGFPVTGVEAQASGLPCVFSDTITRTARLLDEVKYINLDADDRVWADAVLSLVNKNDRSKSKEILRAKGFDIKDMAQTLEKIYLSGDK